MLDDSVTLPSCISGIVDTFILASFMGCCKAEKQLELNTQMLLALQQQPASAQHAVSSGDIYTVHLGLELKWG